MDKKDWKDRLESIKKLRKSEEFARKTAESNIEELSFMISAMKTKIETFK